METPILRFKGLSISKEIFEEKYKVTLTDIEWKAVVSKSENSWKEQADELRLIVFRHIRQAMDEIGYRAELDTKDLIFKKRQ